MDNNTASTTEQQRGNSNNEVLLLLSLEDNKYANLDESQLEEFAKIASPKVSDLLHEQALVLDDLLDTSAWNSDSSSHSSYSSSKKRRRRKKKKKDNNDGNEDDSMNDEWNQLEQNQSSLQDELNAVTLHDFYTTDDRYDNNDNGNDDWNSSIHQYYTANNKQSTGELSSNTGQSSASASTTTTNYLTSPQQQSNKWTSSPNNNCPYTLADHAKTLDITRSESNGRLYTKPLLSRYDIQTLNILSIPENIKHPSSSSMGEVTCISSSNRERYIQTIVNCNIEYIEPIKSKYLKRLFSGWQPGPGENREVHQQQQEERITQQQGGDDSSQRVMAYTPPKSANQSSLDNDNNDDVSSEEEENADNFEDINGMTYESSNKSIMEPLPVRTVTIRIRCDVMCGAVMDALTTSVEGLGGEMTKRQGGHLRAVIPGRKLSVFALGTRERAREILDEINAVVGGESSSPQRGGDSKDSGDEEESSHDDFEVVNSQFDPTTDLPTTSPRHYDDDTSSVASGFSTLLSPILGTPNSHSSRRNQGRTCEVLPPFIIDTQLVTKKVGRECQRLLLIRVFRVQDVARAQVGIGEDEESEAFDMITPLDLDTKGEKVTGGSRKQNDSGAKVKATNPLMESKKSLQGLIEASALVQRIKAVGGNGFAINPQPTGGDDEASVSSYSSTKSYLKSFTDTVTSPIRYFGGTTSSDSPPIQQQQQQQSSPTTQPTVMELMTNYILRKLIPSPSVGSLELAKAKQKSKGVFPALSREDQQYIKSSWMFLKNVTEELDQRCLAYSTLGHSPIFQFPALPSLDVHFIAQIKAFCRESMIISLVKTASDLEIFARESELSCGNVDQLLRPTFDMYKLVPPQLPNPVPLTAYPLEFTPPEEVSPPWGSEVMSALEKISYDTNKNQAQAEESSDPPLTSITLSEKSVSSIVQAFQKQNDIEQGARLGRKNLQVMDRLAKMQAHRQACIAKIRGSYGKNLLATKAADDLHTLRKKSSNVGVGSQTDEIHSASDEVPLLICNVVVGNSAGTCYVTHSHILFQTQLLPLLGGSKVHLFSLMDVEVTINAPTKSVLSPLPSSISFTTGGRKSTREEVYNFIPSIGARRFAKFLEVLRDNA